jgi:hypothetical protein
MPCFEKVQRIVCCSQEEGKYRRKEISRNELAS